MSGADDLLEVEPEPPRDWRLDQILVRRMRDGQCIGQCTAREWRRGAWP